MPMIPMYSVKKQEPKKKPLLEKFNEKHLGVGVLVVFFIVMLFFFFTSF